MVFDHRIDPQRKEHTSTKPPTTPLLGHLPQRPLAPAAERRAQYRGAATEVIGEIFHGANSMVAAPAIHSRKKVRASRCLKSRGGVAGESKTALRMMARTN